MASSANNANANVPLVQGLLRSCATPGCGKQFWSSSHFHCCSDCPATGGFVPTRRCARHGRYMRRGLRPVVHWCRNPNCNRLAGLHHRTCCSQCDGAGRHSNRCDHQWQNIQQQVVVQTQSSSTTAAVGQGANCTSLPTASSAASSSSAVTASNSGTTGVVASQQSDDEKSEVKLDSMD